MKSSILNLFLLILRILLNFGLDASYKSSGFSKILLEKNFEFIPSGRDGIVIFNFGFMLLLAKVDFISKEQSYKRDALKTFNIDHIEIILALLIKVVILHIKAIMVQVKVLQP